VNTVDGDYRHHAGMSGMPRGSGTDRRAARAEINAIRPGSGLPARTV